jgi:hypothetical protein
MTRRLLAVCIFLLAALSATALVLAALANVEGSADRLH